MNNYRLQRSRGRVMFSQASVILSMGGRCLPDIPLGRHPPAGRQTPPDRQTPPGRQTPPPPQQTAIAVDGRHPTGMHSCLSKYLLRLNFIGQKTANLALACVCMCVYLCVCVCQIE